MKRITAGLLFVALLLMCGLSWSKEKENAIPLPETVKVGDLTLTVDHDYSWASHVTAKPGSPEWKVQSAESKAYDAGVKAAQVENQAGRFEKAEALALTSLSRAFYGLSRLRVLMGGTQDDNGYFSNYKVCYDEDPEEGKYCGDNRIGVMFQVAKIQGYCKAARASGKIVDSYGNEVGTVEKAINGYLSGILR